MIDVKEGASKVLYNSYTELLQDSNLAYQRLIKGRDSTGCKGDLVYKLQLD